LHSRIGLDFGILLAWGAVNTLFFPFCCWFMSKPLLHTGAVTHTDFEQDGKHNTTSMNIGLWTKMGELLSCPNYGILNISSQLSSHIIMHI